MMKAFLDPLKIYQKEKKEKWACLFCEPSEAITIEQTEHFRVIIDPFPVVPGHVMITSQAHYGCAGEIPPELQLELIALREYLRSELQGHAGPCIFYEHGRAGCCLPKNKNNLKCDHFHLHCLPLDICIQQHLKNKYKCIRITNYSEIMDLFFQFGDYLYFEESDGSMLFFPTAGAFVEPHLLRTLLCYAIGAPERSNWQAYHDPKIFVQSHAMINNIMNFAR